MVKRKKAEFTPIKEFDGLVESVIVEENEFEGDTKEQYHMIMKPLDEKAIEAVSESTTKRLHNFVSISSTTTITEVAEDSNLDKFLIEVEGVLPDTESMDTHEEVMKSLEGKSFKFRRKRIGKAYKGHDARELFVPVSCL